MTSQITKVHIETDHTTTFLGKRITTQKRLRLNKEPQILENMERRFDDTNESLQREICDV